MKHWAGQINGGEGEALEQMQEDVVDKAVKEGNNIKERVQGWSLPEEDQDWHNQWLQGDQGPVAEEGLLQLIDLIPFLIDFTMVDSL